MNNTKWDLNIPIWEPYNRQQQWKGSEPGLMDEKDVEFILGG